MTRNWPAGADPKLISVRRFILANPRLSCTEIASIQGLPLDKVKALREPLVARGDVPEVEEPRRVAQVLPGDEETENLKTWRRKTLGRASLNDRIKRALARDPTVPIAELALDLQCSRRLISRIKTDLTKKGKIPDVTARRSSAADQEKCLRLEESLAEGENAKVIPLRPRQREILLALQAGERQSALAARLGITRQAVNRVARTRSLDEEEAAQRARNQRLRKQVKALFREAEAEGWL